MNSYLILPGGHSIVSFCRIARIVYRRADRRVILLSEKVKVDESLVKYVNRLFDFLFILARKSFIYFKAE